jgi:hypothetical protein
MSRSAKGFCHGLLLGHVEADDAPTTVGEHDENEEDAQVRGGDGEEINGDEVPDVIGQERPPCLRRRGAPPFRQQTGHGALSDVDAELEKFAVDSGGTPQEFAAAIRGTSARTSAETHGRRRAGRRAGPNRPGSGGATSGQRCRD